MKNIKTIMINNDIISVLINLSNGYIFQAHMMKQLKYGILQKKKKY